MALGREAEASNAAGRAAGTGGTGGSGAGSNDDGRVADKWQLLRALSEARERFRLSDRTISVLEALLSFRPGKTLDGAAPIIVFPSNRELSLRTRGMAPATLRRHIAALVAAELVFRRDSPNGKRFRRRPRDGEGDTDDGAGGDAFGFDLSALALKAGAIFEAAEIERRQARIAARLRQAISLHRRDIRKIVEAALSEERAGPWPAVLQRLEALALPRHAKAPLGLLTMAQADLLRLRAEAETAYLDALTQAEMEHQEMSANDARSERHHQNSTTDPSTESNGHEGWKRQSGGMRGTPAGTRSRAEADERSGETGGDGGGDGSDGGGASRTAEETDPSIGAGAGVAGSGAGEGGRAPEVRGMSFDLSTVLRLCPEITAYALQPVRDWRAFVQLAGLVRGFLGISEDAWRQACRTMGEIPAATVVAAMLQRSDRITSPGGYLRSLTAKAAKGAFRVEPMLRALE
ncbi:hypothetical protein ASG43_19250 [Aureimonas sp. Leaf454]|nr:hypothetical protein ASG43_19250 [Aureimonas sp. Leaf454]